MTNDKLSINSSGFYQKFLPWIMWGCGATFYFYEFFVQISPSVMSNDLMLAFDIKAGKLGILVGLFAYSYAIVQIPAGVLLDKLGPCKLLATASAILASGSILFGNASDFYTAAFGRLCIGMGAASAIIGCMKIATNWFPVNKFALVLGLTVSIGMSGAIVGSAPLAFIMEHYTWREVMQYLGYIGFIFTGIFVFICRNSPKNNPNPNLHDLETITFKKLFSGLKIAITQKQVWVVAVYGLLMFGPSITFCGLWGVPFLQTEYGFRQQEAAFLSSLIFVGWIIGSPLCGYISDRISKRIPTMKYGSILSLIFLSIILYVPDLSDMTLGILLISFGISSSGFLTSFSIVREISPKHCSASVLSFMNTMNSLGPAVFQPLVGKLLSYCWSGALESDGTPLYSTIEFQIAMSSLVISLALASILVFFIKETDCKIVNQ